MLKKQYLKNGGINMEKQTAGRASLGKLAPKFAELNDDVLFDGTGVIPTIKISF